MANAVFANTDIHDCQEAMQTLLHGVMAHTGATLIQTVQQEENSDAEEIWQLFVAQNSGQVFEKSTGMIQTTYRCGNRECSGKSSMWESFNILPLTMPTNNAEGVELESLLSAFQEPFVMPMQNKWRCNVCKTNETATAVRKIKRWPAVLLIHLVRTTVEDGQMKKNDTEVRYPVELQNPQMHLMAVVIHEESPKHFKVVAKRSEGIFEFNDSVVEKIDSLDSRGAYMFVFCRNAAATSKAFGLPNKGNTCYLAAAVQALCSSADFLSGLQIDCVFAGSGDLRVQHMSCLTECVFLSKPRSEVVEQASALGRIAWDEFFLEYHGLCKQDREYIWHANITQSNVLATGTVFGSPERYRVPGDFQFTVSFVIRIQCSQTPFIGSLVLQI